MSDGVDRLQARQFAISWLYPDGPPNPAALRRDEQVGMLTKKFVAAMSFAHARHDSGAADTATMLSRTLKAARLLREMLDLHVNWDDARWRDAGAPDFHRVLEETAWINGDA